jgi:diadenosine tetraphosphate (Ap4A) HIT family hydrolase
VPETPEELYERVKDSLRTPPVEEWDTWPFEGEVKPRALLPPAEREHAREGEGGVDCRGCQAADDEYIWTSERWRLKGLGPMGLPVVVMLEPREHFGELGDLPDDLLAELGVLLGRIERAVRSVGEIGRVHIGKWGDGGEHLHWWFMARPARIPQLASSFAAIWDDILPPTPEDVWRENLAAVKAALEGKEA